MEKIKVADLNDIQEGVKVQLDIVVQRLTEIDTTGKNYSQTMVVVEDLTGETLFPLWKTKDQVSLDLKEGFLYTLVATVKDYKGEKQLHFDHATFIEDTKENRLKIDPSSLKGITDENEQVFLHVIENKFDDKRYQRYAQVAFGLGDVPIGISEAEYRSRLERIKMAWCSINHHDNYSGGLWNHIVGMCRVFFSVKSIYSTGHGRNEVKSTLNWDHILLACYLHDYEKPKEHIMSEDGKTCTRNAEVQVDHIINGVANVELIHHQVEPENRLSFTELEALKYTLLSHHGGWGLYELKTQEDKILHALDLIDASNVDRLVFE